MKRNHKYLICLALLGLLILSSGFVIASETDNGLYNNNPEIQDLNQKIQENQNKIENMKKAAEEYARKIEDYKTQAKTLKNQLNLMDNQILKIQLDIKTLQLQIDKTKLETEAMDFQINKEEQEITAHKNNLMEYIKLIDKNDQRSYLEVLILNNSFAEFFNQLNYLEEMQNNIKQTVDRLNLLKQAMEVQKADKERQQEELEDLKGQLKAREANLKDDLADKENLLLETKSSEIKFQNLLVELKQEQNSIDSQVLDLQEQLKDKIKRLQSGTSEPRDTLLDWPLPAPHEITTYFHDPEYPFRYIFEHPAIDVRAKQGTPIKAPAAGYVARAVDAGMGYSYIILIHDNGISTVYGHVSAIYVKEDTYVNYGDIIGLSGGMPGTRGAGPLTTGPHLHFEVRLNGIPVNPLEYLP